MQVTFLQDEKLKKDRYGQCCECGKIPKGSDMGRICRYGKNFVRIRFGEGRGSTNVVLCSECRTKLLCNLELFEEMEESL